MQRTGETPNEEHPLAPLRWRGLGLATLIYALGYYLLTFPATHRFTTHILSADGDGPQNYWNNWWVRRSLSALTNPWYTDYLYAPDGTTLVTATLNPFNGFLTWPLCLFMGPVAAYNTTVVFSFVACGLTTFLLVRRLTGSFWPSVFAGAVFTFSPYHMMHALGHMQLVALEWVPLFFLAWLLLLERPTHARAGLAAVALFLNLMCDYYYTMFCVLGGALVFAYWLGVRRAAFLTTLRRGWRPWLTFVLAAGALCLPLGLTLLHQLGAEEYHGVHDPMEWRNDLFALFVPGGSWRFHDWTRFYWDLHPNHFGWHENVAYLGLSVMGVGAYALAQHWRTPRRAEVWQWWLLGAVFYALSLGPVLLVLGHDVEGLPTPFALLQWLCPSIAMAGGTSRMAVISYLAAAVLAGYGLALLQARWPARRLGLLLGPFLALFVLEYLSRPQPTYRPHVPPTIERLRTLPPGIVAGLSDDESATLWYQTIFEKPIPTGYVARVPMRLVERRTRLMGWIRKGRYRQLMDESGATYLLRDRSRGPELRDESFKLLEEDASFELYADLDHPAPGIPVAELLRMQASVEHHVEAPGAEHAFVLRSPRDAGRRFCLALSLALAAPPAPGPDGADEAAPELAHDALLSATISREANPLEGNLGRLDERGEARLTLHLPPGRGQTPDHVYASLIVYEEGAERILLRRTAPQRLSLAPEGR